MTKKEYLNALATKGYKQINADQVSLGTLVFDIKETNNQTAMGEQTRFCLCLNIASDLNLCPNPYKM